MSLSQRKERRLATLNPFEDKCWVFAFCYYLDRGKGEMEADELAWLDLQRQFPRLRKYDGCEPSYGKKWLKEYDKKKSRRRSRK